MAPSLNIVAEGIGESQRVGRKIRITSININGTWKNVAQTDETLTDQRVRIIVYVDSQTNGIAVTTVGILESAGIDTFRNLSNSKRFRLLCDKKIALTYPSVAQTAANTFTTLEVTKRWSLYKKLNLVVDYDNSVTTGALTSQRTNNIGVLILSETASAPPLVSVLARIRYSDA